MNKTQVEYDVAIIGGGLAGLSLAISLRSYNYSVVLVEKEKYPFHRVCGEYISLESWAYLESLGVNLTVINPPIIKELIVTAPNGSMFKTKLPVGGFGISRYKLDNILMNIAKERGVTIYEETRVEDVVRSNELFVVLGKSIHKSEPITITTRLCFGAFGKRSHLDIKWKREKVNPGVNYVGIKYHVHTDWPAETIGLHNFKNGYCGVSRIEDDKFCLCYMTDANNLKSVKGNIQKLEQQVLSVNPHLRELLNNSIIVEGFPITISQISFNMKEKSSHDVIMLGDAAGMITPLCGNGMSMALHSGKLASSLADRYLSGKMALSDSVNIYKSEWKRNFGKRMQTGRVLQKFFGKTVLTNMFISTFKLLPFTSRPLISMTHGQPF